MEPSIEQDFLTTATKRLKYYKDLGDKAMAQLEPEDLFYSPGEESNSIAVIVQHVHGNMMSRWTNFLTEDGEKPWRQRDREFENIIETPAAVLENWEEGWKCLFGALSSLQASDLKKNVTIRQEPLTVVDAINRQLAHYPYHVGQIVFLARMIKKQGWESLSIPRGQSEQYNQSSEIKDPAKNFK
jgi:Protein of unknown function (DUF1572)